MQDKGWDPHALFTSFVLSPPSPGSSSRKKAAGETSRSALVVQEPFTGLCQSCLWMMGSDLKGS